MRCTASACSATVPPAALDVAASFGERLSALIVSAYLNRFRRARFVDARQFLTTDEQFTHANVNLPEDESRGA